MKVCIIIPTFNSWQVTAETVKKLLYEQTYKDFDIIIVDAGSKDYEKLKEIFKDEKRVIILHTEKDLGGAGSFWLGMKYAYEKGYDIFILSDNDAIPLSNNLIEELIKSEKPCVPINYEKRKLIEKNDYINWYWFHFLTLDKKIVEKIGFPAFEFFIWLDDIEYTYKRLGKIKVVKQYYTHKWAADTIKGKSKREYYRLRNSMLIYFRRTNYTFLNLFRIFFLQIFKLTLEYTKFKHWKYFINFSFEAYNDAINGNFGKVNKKIPLNLAKELLEIYVPEEFRITSKRKIYNFFKTLFLKKRTPLIGIYILLKCIILFFKYIKNLHRRYYRRLLWEYYKKNILYTNVIVIQLGKIIEEFTLTAKWFAP